MANVYDESTLTGFNTDPPSDAGAQTEENTVEWAKHIQKIGTPLKNFSESINSNISTGFAKATMLGGVKAVSTTYTLLATDQGKVLNCTGTFTLTLLTAATAGSQFVIAIVNTGAGVITVDGSGSETINGETTITINPKGALLITSDGSNWYGFRADSAEDFIGTFVDDSGGYPISSQTAFNVHTQVTEMVGATTYNYESVGPTGSGADNIWTALDGLPSSINWIELRVLYEGASSADTASVSRTILAGFVKNGTAASGSTSLMVYGQAYTDASGNGKTSGVSVFKVPVASKVFDVSWYSSFSTLSTISLYLSGYGYNP